MTVEANVYRFLLMMTNAMTTAQTVTADFAPGEFWNGDDKQIEDVAQDHGAKVIGTGSTTVVYRFDDGSAVVVSSVEWVIV